VDDGAEQTAEPMAEKLAKNTRQKCGNSSVAA